MSSDKWDFCDAKVIASDKAHAKSMAESIMVSTYMAALTKLTAHGTVGDTATTCLKRFKKDLAVYYKKHHLIDVSLLYYIRENNADAASVLSNSDPIAYGYDTSNSPKGGFEQTNFDLVATPEKREAFIVRCLTECDLAAAPTAFPWQWLFVQWATHVVIDGEPLFVQLDV